MAAKERSLRAQGLCNIDAGGALEEEFWRDVEAAAEAGARLETRRQKLKGRN